MLLGDFVPQTPYPVSVLSKIKISSFQSYNIDSYMNECEHAQGPSFVIKILAPNIPQNGSNH